MKQTCQAEDGLVRMLEIHVDSEDEHVVDGEDGCGAAAQRVKPSLVVWPVFGAALYLGIFLLVGVWRVILAKV